MFALTLAFVAAPVAKLQADELKRFEGTWKVVRLNNRDEDLREQDGDLLVTFKGAEVTFVDREPTRYSVDPSRDPKWFTLHSKLLTKDPIPVPGIYKFDGNKLALLLVNGGGTRKRDRYGLDPRPTTWDLNKLDRNHQVQLIEFERVKK